MTANPISNHRDPTIQNLRFYTPDADVFVTTRLPGLPIKFFGEYPRLVVHDVGDRVWVWSHYAERLPDGIVPVGDGKNNGYDHAGTRLVSIPADWCMFMDKNTAEEIVKAIDADYHLLLATR